MAVDVEAAARLRGARVLITGGTGFIGQHLVTRCLKLGAGVAVLSHRAPPGRFPDHVTLLRGDLRQAESLADALGGRAFDLVFNLGGYIDHTPYFAGGRTVVEQHLTGLMNLIDVLDRSALLGFVQVGSSDECGDQPAPQAGTSGSPPISPYAFAKRACTDLVRALATQEGFPGTATRLFLVYGPGQSVERLLPQVIRACLRDEAFPISPGEQTRDFCFIEDVVEGLILAALASQAHGRVLNIASGQPVRIRTMVETIVALVGGGRPQFGARPYRRGESMALFADISETRDLLGWHPRTPLAEGLARTVDAYRGAPTGIPASS